MNITDAFENLIKTSDSTFFLECKLSSINEIWIKLKDLFGFIVLNDIIAKEDKNSFIVIYHLSNYENKTKLFLETKINQLEDLPSAQDIWKNAKYFEMEIWDCFGINVTFENRKRILNSNSFKGHPFLKDFNDNDNDEFSDDKELLPIIEHSVLSSKRKDEDHWISFGPCSNNIKRPLQLHIKTNQSYILDCLPKIGHVHRGVEKIAAEKDFFQFITFAERINYQSSGLGSIVWCKTVEELLDIEISDRSKALRMIFLELGRMIDHFICLSNICKEVSFNEFAWKSLDLSNALNNLFIGFNGKKIFPAPARIGGLSNKLPNGWSAECIETIKYIKSSVLDFENELIRSRLWMDSLKVGAIDSKTAIELGVTGPILRACGINFDLRKDRPYYFYEEVEFDIPLGVRGDVHDRYLVRFEEIKQSINIVTQVIDNLPIEKNDDLNYDSNFWFDLEETALYKTVYNAVESSNGEFGFYISSVTNKKADRVKICTPSFKHVFTLPPVLKGNDLDSIPLSIESLNIIPTEHDR